MGEYADQILEGSVCQYCGEYMHEFEAAPGYPVTCAGCDKHTGPDVVHKAPRKAKTIRCDQQDCFRWFSSDYALAQHRRDKHG